MFVRSPKRFISGLVLLLWSSVSLAEPVDVELALLVDVSGSVDSYEFKLQQQGYAEAFKDPDIVNQILDTSSGTLGKIAVTLIYWSAENSQRQSIPWTLIDSKAASEAFGEAILEAQRPFGGSTDIGPAINFATPLFFSNGYEGARLVMDVSGDGVDSTEVTANARDLALASGITTINGIVIGDQKLLGFYQEYVIGGEGAFARQVANFSGFREQVKLKIYAEVTTFPVAEDDSVLLEQNETVDVNILENDTYTAGLDEIVIKSIPVSGEAVLNSDNTISYTPEIDFTGKDNLVYQVTDLNGRVASAVVNLEVAEPVVTDPPDGQPPELPGELLPRVPDDPEEVVPEEVVPEEVVPEEVVPEEVVPEEVIPEEVVPEEAVPEEVVSEEVVSEEVVSEEVVPEEAVPDEVVPEENKGEET